MGVDKLSKKNLILENLSKKVTTNIGTLRNSIRTILYDPKTKSLFAGDKFGRLHQYQRSRDEDQFKLVKDYGNVGIGPISSSCLCGDLAFFGGFGFSLAAVKISEKKLVKGTFRTAIGSIYSLEACRVSNSRVLVSVGGGTPSYSESLSDVLEVKCEVDDTESESESQRESSRDRKKKKVKKKKNLKMSHKKKNSIPDSN